MIEHFNSVEWMRRRRAEIDAEDEGLSWQERAAKAEKALENDPVWARIRNRIAIIGVGEKKAADYTKH